MLIIYNRFFKFCAGGLLYNLIAYSCYCILILLNVNFLIASTFSFILGVKISYFINKKIVFKSDDITHKQVLYYFLFYSTALIINLFLLDIAVKVLNIHPLLAQIIVSSTNAIISYIVVKYLFDHYDSTQEN